MDAMKHPPHTSHHPMTYPPPSNNNNHPPPLQLNAPPPEHQGYPTGSPPGLHHPPLSHPNSAQYNDDTMAMGVETGVEVEGDAARNENTYHDNHDPSSKSFEQPSSNSFEQHQDEVAGLTPAGTAAIAAHDSNSV